MSSCNSFQLTSSLLDVKKSFLKTNKLDSDFQLWTETPPSPKEKALDIENSRGYPRRGSLAAVTEAVYKFFTNLFLLQNF